MKLHTVTQAARSYALLIHFNQSCTLVFTCFPVQHLRLLRHPNILKFLSCELSRDYITMATEPVIPLNQLLEKMCMEGLVMGWRGVAQGLIFLHDKV